MLCTKLGHGEVKTTYLLSRDGCCRSVAAGAVGASLGGVPGQNSGNVPNGGASRNHHVHSSTCSHHHQGNSQIGSIPLGLGTLGLSIVVMMDNTLHRKLQVDTKLCVNQ